MDYNIRKGLNTKGFTLVELLVVIAIIGLLSSMTVLLFNHARAKARDAQRLHSLKQFQTALDLFYDQYNVYPCGDANASGNNGCASEDNCMGDSSGSEPFLNGELSSPPSNCTDPPYGGLAWAGFLDDTWPKDPINELKGGIRYLYRYDVFGDRQSYVLGVYLETDQEAMENDGGRCSDLYEVGPAVGIIYPWKNVVGVTGNCCCDDD